MTEKVTARLKQFGRMLKLQYIKLLRSPGGARKVALGFAIGFGSEMLVISTAMVIYIFLIPIVRMARASLPAAIIGNLICKATILPVLLLPIAMRIGRMLAPSRPLFIPRSVYFYLHTLLGMSIFAVVLGVISFFPVYYLYEARRRHREKIRTQNRSARASKQNDSLNGNLKEDLGLKQQQNMQNEVDAAEPSDPNHIRA